MTEPVVEHLDMLRGELDLFKTVSAVGRQDFDAATAAGAGSMIPSGPQRKRLLTYLRRVWCGKTVSAPPAPKRTKHAKGWTREALAMYPLAIEEPSRAVAEA